MNLLFLIPATANMPDSNNKIWLGSETLTTPSVSAMDNVELDSTA